MSSLPSPPLPDQGSHIYHTSNQLHNPSYPSHPSHHVQKPSYLIAKGLPALPHSTAPVHPPYQPAANTNGAVFFPRPPPTNTAALSVSTDRTQGSQPYYPPPDHQQQQQHQHQQYQRHQHQLSPLALQSRSSFSAELGAYLSDQEAFQPPPPLQEALQQTSLDAHRHRQYDGPGDHRRDRDLLKSDDPVELAKGGFDQGPAFVTVSKTITVPGSGPSASATVVLSKGGEVARQQPANGCMATVASPSSPSSSSSSSSSVSSSLPFPPPPLLTSSSNTTFSSPPTTPASASAYPLPPPLSLSTRPQQNQSVVTQLNYTLPTTSAQPYNPRSTMQQPPVQSPPSQQQQQQQAPPHEQYQQQPTKQPSYPLPPPSVRMGDLSSPSTLVPSLGIPSPVYPPGGNNGGFGNDQLRSPSPSLHSLNNGRPLYPFQGTLGDRSPSPSPTPSGHRHLRAASQGQPPSSGRASPLRVQPAPTKSEDWAALVDSPASPTHSYPNVMRPYSYNYQPPPILRPYSESPAPEGTPSLDYLQHQSQGHPSHRHSMAYEPQHQQHQQGLMPHSRTDPLVHQRGSMGHQQHNSSSGIPLSFTGNPGPGDLSTFGGMSLSNNRQQHRKSWSPNTVDPLEGVSPSVPVTSTYGSHTPPHAGGSRSGTHSKQNSVATSVSLLNDATLVAKYRETAIKTNDTSLQLAYAKYLLDIGESSMAAPITAEDPSSNGFANVPPSSSSSGTSPPKSMPSLDGPDGMGKKQLTLEAIYWIDRLAKEGQPEAQFIRGTWYEEGLYMTKRNADKALRWFQSASKGDFPPAHYKVAFYCEKRKDNNKAVVLYKKAAIHNDVPANHRLAIIYLYGELGQAKNMKAGLQYLKRAASFATENSPMAPFVLGLIMAREYTQLTIPDDIAFPDDGEALEWFRKSAQLGYGPANYKLGYCYEYGTFGCQIDPFLSMKHYERAVLTGDSNGEAEMALSGWYLSGAEGCFEANDGLAFKYAMKAAEKQLPKAQYAMGYYYEVGISVPIDILKAMEYYKLAAANGSKEAVVRLSEQSTFDKSGHKNSIRKINQGRNAKDQNCILM